MAADVVVLETGREKVVASVVDTLQSALDQALAGRITAVAIAVVRPGGAVNTSRSECDDVGRLLGAMALSQFRMCQSIDGD